MGYGFIKMRALVHDLLAYAGICPRPAGQPVAGRPFFFHVDERWSVAINYSVTDIKQAQPRGHELAFIQPQQIAIWSDGIYRGQFNAQEGVFKNRDDSCSAEFYPVLQEKLAAARAEKGAA